MTAQPNVDELMEHTRREQAALTAERVALAERRTAYELRGAVAQPRPMLRPEPTEGMGAIAWLGIAVTFALGFVLVFVCGPWSLVVPSPWTVGGTVGGGVLLALATAAAGRMAQRR